jgi:aspartate racemase
VLLPMNNKIIGIIGGMGPQASLALYELLILRAQKHYGIKNNNEYPEIVIDSVPVPDFISDQSKQEEAAQILEKRIQQLNIMKVSFITMSCNTACILIDRLQKRTPIPIISIINEVIALIHVEDTPILLLASPTSLKLGLYQLALARYDIPYIVPKKKDYRELEYLIRSVIQGKDKEILKHKIVHLVERYRISTNMKGILLGCTELPLIFPMNYPLPTYNSLSILADGLLKRYYKKEDI